LAAGVLDVTATVGGTGNDTVLLSNTHTSALGNTTIGKSGNIATSFTFTDFTGGRAKDCLVGTGCMTDNDCKTTCNTTVTPHVCL